MSSLELDPTPIDEKQKNNRTFLHSPDPAQIGGTGSRSIFSKLGESNEKFLITLTLSHTFYHTQHTTQPYTLDEAS